MDSIDMAEYKGRGSLDFHPAGRRYAAPAQREARASGCFGPAPGSGPGFGQGIGAGRGDSFRKALADISSEDEAYPTLADQGPIVFRDGVFQIELPAGTGGAVLDPALKGLIDSILDPRSTSSAPEEEG